MVYSLTNSQFQIKNIEKQRRIDQLFRCKSCVLKYHRIRRKKYFSPIHTVNVLQILFYSQPTFIFDQPISKIKNLPSSGLVFSFLLFLYLIPQYTQYSLFIYFIYCRISFIIFFRLFVLLTFVKRTIYLFLFTNKFYAHVVFITVLLRESK